MRLSNETRYPHPVLSPFTDDYKSGHFEVSFTVEESPETGAMVLKHSITLSEPSISKLVEMGQAEIGCIVRCLDTFHISLCSLRGLTGLTEFKAGKLINTVFVRPLIWLKSDILDIGSDAISSEFGAPIPLKKGDVIALDSEVSISAGKAKLAKAESIFELNLSEDVREGQVKVGLANQRISIYLGRATFNLINQLRNKEEYRPVVMNSVYLPAVMETLDLLRQDASSYVEHRWYSSFTEKCVHYGIDLNAEFSLIEAAGKLLESPLLQLEPLIKGDDHE